MRTGDQIPAAFLPDPHAARSNLLQRIGAFTAVAGYSASLILGSPSHEPAPAATSIEASCPAPSSESIETVTEMFDNPPIRSLNPNPRGATSQSIQEYIIAQRQEVGIRMPNYDHVQSGRLGSALNTPGQTPPFQDYLQFAEGVLDQLDIPITIGVPDGVDAKVPTQAELESRNAKYQVLQIADMFGIIPMNLTEQLGINGVVLTAHGNGYAGQTFDGILIIDIVNAGETYSTDTHELFHIIDAAMCGQEDAQNDPGYARLNTYATYAYEWPLPEGFMDSQPIPLDAVKDDTYYELDTQRWEADDLGDAAAYCVIQATMDNLVKDVEMTDQYSHRSVTEDKANVGRHIVELTNYSEMLDPAKPVIRQKFLFLLARMYEMNPEVVEYYAANAGRTRDPASDCNKTAGGHTFLTDDARQFVR